MVTPIQSSSNEALDMRVRKYSFIFIYKAVVKTAADRIVKWNTDSIVSAIRGY